MHRDFEELLKIGMRGDTNLTRQWDVEERGEKRPFTGDTRADVDDSFSVDELHHGTDSAMYNLTVFSSLLELVGGAYERLCVISGRISYE